MNLTLEMMLNLKKYGFTFEQFEHDCNVGMVYYYNQQEHFLGGIGDGTPMSEEDQIIAKDGIWLPNESDLMTWLQWKWEYDVTIKYVNSQNYFYGVVENSDGTIIKGSGPTLLCCLYKLVLKVCKHNRNQSHA